MKTYRNTWININLDNLKYNIDKIINFNKKYDYYFGVVKANAYSHGDIEISKEIIKHGINYLAVSSLEEAINIRKKIKKIPILCLEPIDVKYLFIAKKFNVTISVNSLEYAEKIKNKKLNLKIHIKLDTGMNRLGIKDKKELEKTVLILKSNSNFELEGIFTHFATSDCDENFYNYQVSKFLELTKNLDLSIFKIIHIDNSASQLNYEKLNFVNGARIGISMYGVNTTNKDIKLKPVLSLYSKIIQIKDLKKGEGVSYGLKYVAQKNEKIAIVPIGYADGIIRKNTGRNVLINNIKYKIIGNICMDMLIVLVDNLVKENDIVTLIGDSIDTKYISNYLDTIEYEVLCTLSDRIPRFYYKNNNIITSEYKRFK